MPLSQGEFSDLVGRIYDCGRDPELWPDTLARLVEALGAVAGWIGVHDAETGTGRLAVDVGLSPDHRSLYAERFAGLSPLALGTWFTQVGDVVGLSELIDRDAFRGTHFYREWCRPQQVEDLIAGVLTKASGGCGSLSASFDRPVSLEARELMTLLLPHVRRAVETGQLLAEQSGEAEGLSSAMDALSLGVFLLDAAGRVLRANAAAEAILRQGDALRRLPAGTLATAEPWSQGALEGALAACRDDDRTRCRAALPFPSRRGSRPRGGLVGQIVPVRGAACGSRAGRGGEGERQPVAALFVQDPDAAVSIPSEALERLYGLTQGELRVLRGLMQDMTLSEIAEAYGIGVATVRTHLARLFDKTGTRRQAELLRAVMAAAPALRPAEARPGPAGRLAATA
ncbi:helix-turn-helix transcriptional regulator [Methylobacterium sp. WSM2598]|uniref:helix-turn-helix transcriptional regulator n=1 Tax=Methylobacterium sp. WSM2598 TaxID=398261 RepID=UPI0003702304|nr:helix-turn-helix transcriptional regulator [Methylobacterium sp. WSM2598]